MHEDLGRRLAGPGRPQRSEQSETAEGALEQVFHLVEQEQRPPVVGDQALGEPEFLESLAARRLIAVIVRFADAVEGCTEPRRQRLAEFRLAGAGRPVKQNVDARRPTVQRAFHQLLDMVPGIGDMVEIRPFEIARRRDIQEQARDVDVPVAGRGREATESSRDCKVAIVVDGDKPRADERRTVPQAGLDPVCCQTEKQRHRPAAEIEHVHGWTGTLENVVDHRLEDRVRLVAQQQFEDVQIRPIETCRLSEPPEPQGGPVAPRRLVRTLVPQGFFEAPQLLCRDFLFIEIRIPMPPAMAPPLGAEGNAVVPIGDPVDQFPGLRIPMVQARSDVRQIRGEQIVFVGVQHGSLQFEAMERR